MSHVVAHTIGTHTGLNFLDFMQFLGKSGKFVCWRPLLRRILNPPLVLVTVLRAGPPSLIEFHSIDEYQGVKKHFGESHVSDLVWVKSHLA